MSDLPCALPIPYRHPLGAFAAFADETPAAFLDSAAQTSGHGRYAYIAADPFLVMIGDETADPFDSLDADLKQFRMLNNPDLPPFQGGKRRYRHGDPAQRAFAAFRHQGHRVHGWHSGGEGGVQAGL